MPRFGPDGWEFMCKDEDATAIAAALMSASARPAGMGFRFRARNLARAAPDRKGAQHVPWQRHRGSAHAPRSGRRHPGAGRDWAGSPRDGQCNVLLPTGPVHRDANFLARGSRALSRCPSGVALHAFGPDDLACLTAARGGNLRVGFENGLTATNGRQHKGIATSGATLID